MKIYILLPIGLLGIGLLVDTLITSIIISADAPFDVSPGYNRVGQLCNDPDLFIVFGETTGFVTSFALLPYYSEARPEIELPWWVKPRSRLDGVMSTTIGVGWPLRSRYCSRESALGSGNHAYYDQIVLKYTQIPVGLILGGAIANSAIWGGCAFVLFTFFRCTVRGGARMMRRRRECCEQCGYAIADLSVCPECGSRQNLRLLGLRQHVQSTGILASAGVTDSSRSVPELSRVRLCH